MILFDSNSAFQTSIEQDDHGWISEISYKPAETVLTTGANVWQKAGAASRYVSEAREPETLAVECSVTRDQGGDNNYRAELRGNENGVSRNLVQHVPYWFAFSVFVDPAWVSDNLFTVLFQTHTTSNAPAGTSPGIGLYIREGHFFYRARSSADGAAVVAGPLEWFGHPIVPGAWYDIAMRFVADNHPGGDAVCDLWLNGLHVLHSTAPNASLETDGETEDPFYLNFGTYKSPWSDAGASSRVSARTFRFASIKIGDGDETLGTVSPATPNPAPPRPGAVVMQAQF